MTLDSFLASTHTDEAGCRIWSGQNGVRYEGHKVTARKMAFFLYHGEWPKTRLLATCGNKACVCKHHIYEGANIDTPQFKDRFWSRVQPATDDKCWPWMRACTSAGYGQLYVGDTAFLAHRIAYYLAHGSWPKVACHTCDNPICCNPKHICNGTYQLNMHHRSQRGRHNTPKGEANGRSYLTEEQVRAIRSLATTGQSQGDIAQVVGCSQANVSQIVNRKNWSHI